MVWTGFIAQIQVASYSWILAVSATFYRTYCIYLQRLLSFIVTAQMIAEATRRNPPKPLRTATSQRIQQLADLTMRERQTPGISSQIRNYLNRLENDIFLEDGEISAILDQDNTVRLDGLTYQQIQASCELSTRLQKVRMNAPAYQNMHSLQKKKYFQKLAIDYVQQLSAKKEEQQELKSLLDNEETVEASQNSIIKEKKFGKKIKKNTAFKVNFISEVQQDSDFSEIQIKKREYKTPKKVSFFSGSQKKYFDKHEPVYRISQERIYTYYTLDKL